MPFIEFAKLMQRDLELKGGPEFDQESINLTNIYKGRGRQLTRAWLGKLGQGDPENIKPFQTKFLKQMIHLAAVTYATPPTRRLELDDVPLGDVDQRLLERTYKKTDRVMKQADRWRTGLGQSVVYFYPSDKKKRACARVFQPHNILRDADDTHADEISSDERVAFCVAHNQQDNTQSIYHYFQQVEENVWDAFRVNGAGNLINGDRDALYPLGEVPFERAPFVMIYDEDPEGEAYIPIDETRTAFALSMNVVINEILYLLKQEAHTVLYGAGFTNTQDLPDKWGPGSFWGFEDPEARIQPVALNPKLLESIRISDHIAATFSAGEGIPADYFLAGRKYESGAAGKLRQQDLDARRADQQQDAIETEEEVFEIHRAINNEYAGKWKVPRFDEAWSIAIELGRPSQPVDRETLQKTYAWDLSCGFASAIDYLMERDSLTRAQAEKKWTEIQVAREKFPLRENPAAILGGPAAASGPGSATPANSDPTIKPDASSINPNRAASNEQASAVGAARKGMTPKVA